MLFRTLLTGAVMVALVPLATISAQGDLETRISSIEKVVKSLGSSPGLALRVNGEVVPATAWQRALIYISGRQILEKKILVYIIEERLEELSDEEIRAKRLAVIEPKVQAELKANEQGFLAKNPGKSYDDWLHSQDSSRADQALELREKYLGEVKLPNEEELRKASVQKWRTIADDKVKSRIEQTIAEFKQKNPDQDFWKTVARMGSTETEYWDVARSTLLFDRLYFPGKPSEWPAITREAIYASAGDQGKQFFDSMEKSVAENPKGQVPPLFMGIFRMWTLKKLKEWADLKYASHGLKPDVVLSYNGREFATEDAFRKIKEKISSQDETRALREIVLSTALTQELKKGGFLLTEEEFKVAWKEHCKPYEGSPFTIEVIATNFKGYPSMEAYRTRFKLIEGYNKLLKSKGLLADGHLTAFIPKIASFLGEGAVDVELIRFPAKNDETGKWIAGGYAAAKAQADTVLTALEKGTMTFEEARGLGKWAHGTTHGGVFGRKSRNEFRRDLGEFEYTDFVFGYSVADILFDQAPEGKVIGPLFGVDGYYLGLVRKRFAPRMTPSLRDAKMKDMIKQEYLTRKFLDWANDVAAKTKVD